MKGEHSGSTEMDTEKIRTSTHVVPSLLIPEMLSLCSGTTLIPHPEFQGSVQVGSRPEVNTNPGNFSVMTRNC